jgi:succinylarginine dihydrolase
MAVWTSPITWVDGTRYVAADLNAQVRDNMLVLRAGGFAISGMAADDFIYASTATQLTTLAAVEGASPTFVGGVWTMSPSGGSGDNASFVIAAESFG